METNVRFILADKHDLTRAGLRAYALRMGNCLGVEEAGGKKELARKMNELKRGVVVVDYTTFDFNGIEDMLILLHRFPDFGWVLCSTDLSEDFIRRAGAEENVGILFKDSGGNEITRAFEAAMHGGHRHCSRAETILSTERGHKEIEEVLTATEIEVLKLIARGMSVKEIAAARISSAHTIITHKKNIFRKLGVNNVYEATKYALRAGLLEMMEYYI